MLLPLFKKELYETTWTLIIEESKHIYFMCAYILTWGRQWQPTPVFLPGKSHERRSLVGGLQSMVSLRVRHDWATSLSLFTFHFHVLEKEMATHSSILAWRIPGRAEPGGLPSMGSHRVRHDWGDLAAAAATYIHIIYFMYSNNP